MDAIDAPPFGSEITLTVNGHPYTLTVDNRSCLLDVLRDDLALTGAKKGCDHGQCGACTVLLDGRRMNSCLLLAAAQDGAAVTTVEGLAGPEGVPHPLQRAFAEEDAFQCGFCTPGQLCSAVGLLAETDAADGPADGPADDPADGGGGSGPAGGRRLTEEAVREGMSGNICRCGAYPGIVRAVCRVAAAGEDGR